jgi:hypothetical protein
MSKSPDAKSESSAAGQPPMEASFSTLILSVGSSAAMAIGMVPNPANGKIEKNVDLARFNIDLLRMLREKTKNNLSADEQRFLDSLISDLQMKFCQGC